MSDLKFYFAIIVSLLILLGAYRYYKDTNALRDDSTAENKPYSFARVQLWWWTIVIIISFIMVYGVTGEFWPMNQTCLILLGISLGTTTAGRLIDNQQINDVTVVRHQDTPSQGLLIDILSDEHGLSVHRFQTLLFNLIYSASFIIQVFGTAYTKHVFPEFDSPTLALLGVSSSAYLALKLAEGKGLNPPPPAGS